MRPLSLISSVLCVICPAILCSAALAQTAGKDPSLSYTSDCSDMQARVRGVPVKGLQLKAELVQKRVDPGAKVSLSLTVTNVSKEDKEIWLSDIFWDYTFCIESPDGKTTRIARGDAGSRWGNVMVKLEPGKSYARGCVISEAYDFTQPGGYRITAGMKRIGENGPGSLDAVSNSVDLTVAKPGNDSASTAPATTFTISLGSSLSKDTERKDFTLKATPSTSNVAIGSVVTIDLELKNVSKSERKVYVGNDWRIYEASVESPQQQHIFCMTERYGEPAGKMKTLKPGESIRETYQLGTAAYEQVGTYKVVLIRHLGSFPSTKEGSVNSNVFELTLTKPIALQQDK